MRVQIGGFRQLHSENRFVSIFAFIKNLAPTCNYAVIQSRKRSFGWRLESFALPRSPEQTQKRPRSHLRGRFLFYLLAKPAA